MEETNIKEILLKKLNVIYRESLPYIVVGSSISMCVLQFINTGCTLDPNVKSFISSSYNSTAIGDFEIEKSLNSVSRGIVVVNGFFALVMGVYGQIVKKELAKVKNENGRLSDELETLTLQQRPFNTEPIAFNDQQTNPPASTRSEDTIYPTAIQIQ